MQNTGEANILSTPNLLTLDNQSASILVGKTVPFVTGQYVTNGSNGSNNPFQTIEREDVGLKLNIRPQISEGGTVKLDIYQEVSSIDESRSSITNGIVTNKRAIDTSVLVDDGQIIVLGGLLEDSVTLSSNAVPGLSAIPVLGNLFRYDSRKRTKTNLMVFLRPYVMRDANRAAGVTMDRYDYMRRAQAGAQPGDHWLLPNQQAPMLTAPGSAPSVSGNAYDMRPENLAETMRRPPPATGVLRRAPVSGRAPDQRSGPAVPRQHAAGRERGARSRLAVWRGRQIQRHAAIRLGGFAVRRRAHRPARAAAACRPMCRPVPAAWAWCAARSPRIRARCPPPRACCASWATRAKWCRTYERRLASGGSGRMSAHPLPYACARAQRAAARRPRPADGQPAHAGMGAARDPPLPRRRGGGAGRGRGAGNAADGGLQPCRGCRLGHGRGRERDRPGPAAAGHARGGRPAGGPGRRARHPHDQRAVRPGRARDGASDIHIEPFETHSVVRYRVDGTLRDVVSPRRAACRADLAHQDHGPPGHRREAPAAGRPHLRVGGRPIDVRVSTLPTGHGERAVLRLWTRKPAGSSSNAWA